MPIDDRSLRLLITESQDLQSDAMRVTRESLPQLTELRHERRKLLRSTGALALVAAGAGSLRTFLSPTAAAAQSGETNVDVQIMNAASSLENLAVATYAAALSLPFIANGNAKVKAFAQTTMKQHSEHGAGFNAQAKARGKEQNGPNPVLAPEIEKAKAGLKTPLDVVKLAADLENVATETYLKNLTLLGSTELKLISCSCSASIRSPTCSGKPRALPPDQLPAQKR